MPATRASNETREAPMKPGLFLAVLAATFLALLAGVTAASAATQGSAAVALLDESGEIDGAPYRIVVPANWNGTLIEFVRGYVDKADHAGEVDDRTPRIAQNSAVEAVLLARGYALAGSARRDNGWAVEEGLGDVVALVSYFRDTIARPKITLLWGSSLGTVITLATAERTGGVFDGYLAQCGVGAGALRVWDEAADLELAYDVVFGMPAAWGVPGDVRDDLDFGEISPLLSAHYAASFGRFEFIRLVAGDPGSGIVPPPSFFTPLPGGLPLWVRQVMFFATEGQAELERRAGGPVAQNLNRTYRLSADEQAYLATLGVDADPLLAAMNARRDIAAPPASRNYLEHFADYNGRIKRPVLTLHTRVDELVHVSHEAAYRATVDAAGRGDLLVQAYTSGVSHCSFSTDQQLTTIGALEDWVRTGTRPSADAFPVSLGFLAGFSPPAWLQP
jgi:hypothetical protein